MLKFEVGRAYDTRGGDATGRVEITSVLSGSNTYPVIGTLKGEAHIWTGEGRFLEGEESDLDLVSEWVPVVSEWADPPAAVPDSKKFWTAARSVLGRESDHAGIMQSLAEKLGVGPEPPSPPVEIEVGGWAIACVRKTGVYIPGDLFCNVITATIEKAEYQRVNRREPDAWEVVRLVGMVGTTGKTGGGT